MMTLEQIVDRNWGHIAIARMYTYTLGYTSEKYAIKTIAKTLIFIDRVERDIAMIADLKARKAAREAGL